MDSHIVVPQSHKTVTFLEDQLLAAEINGQVFVSIKSVAHSLGFTKGQYDRQVKNIKTDLVLSQGASNVTLPTTGGMMEVSVMNVEFLPIWLAKISITPAMTQNTPQIARKLVEYQLKAKDVLFRAFFPQNQQLSFEDALILQLGEQKKMKQELQMQQQYLNEYGARLVQNEQKVDRMIDHLTKSPERANIRHGINEYCRRRNLPQDHAWSALSTIILDRFGVDLPRRVDNKRKAIQVARLQLGKRAYADSTLKSKYTMVDAIFDAELQQEVLRILAGMIR